MEYSYKGNTILISGSAYGFHSSLSNFLITMKMEFTEKGGKPDAAQRFFNERNLLEQGSMLVPVTYIFDSNLQEDSVQIRHFGI